MYLREIFELNEEVTVQQVGDVWKVIDTDDANRVLWQGSNENTAKQKATRVTNQRLHGGGSNNPPNKGNNPQPSNKRQSSNKSNNSKSPKTDRPTSKYLGKGKFAVKYPNGASFNGSPSEVVDNVIQYYRTANPNRANAIVRHRAKYTKYITNLASGSKKLRWFNKFLQITGPALKFVGRTAIPAGQFVHTVLGEATDLEILREVMGYQELTDPTGEALNDLLTDAMHECVVGLGTVLAGGALLSKLSLIVRLFRGGAVFGGPIGWIMIVISELLLQGVSMYATKFIVNRTPDIVKHFMYSPLVDVVRNARNKVTGLELGEEETTNEQIGTDIERNADSVKSDAKAAAEAGDIPASELPKIDQVLDATTLKFIKNR